jgi:hypothetical protein
LDYLPYGSFVHLALVKEQSLTFVLAYEAGYTLTMLLMSYVLLLPMRWLQPPHRPDSFKFTLIATTVLIIVVYLIGGARFGASASAQDQQSLRDAALRIIGGSLVMPGFAAYCEKYV